MCQTDESCTFQNGGTQSYSARESVELVLNEGSDLEDFSDSGSEENIVDSGEEFVPVHLEADSSDGDNNIFIFIIGICALGSVLLRQRRVYDMTGLFIWPHPKLSENVYIIPSILFTTIFF